MYKLEVLVSGSIVLKSGNIEKYISENCVLTDEEGLFFADSLVKYQKSKILTLEIVEENIENSSAPELTPEEKLLEKEKITSELDSLKEEIKTASESRKEEIKSRAKELKQQAKEL